MQPVEIPFIPSRVVLQDFTGVPAIVDLAAMRSAIVDMTGDVSNASKVNPLVRCDLVIDHSVQVDAFNSATALTINSNKEFERNQERYEFLKWGQSAFDNFQVVPPATGIIHQVNLEYLAKVTWDNGSELYPDSLVGTDSHTTMINGLGVLGWGVGGIEAEACMLGQPIYMLIPEVVGFKFTGALPEGSTATDLVLRVTQMLREHGVVGKFVEYFGPGLASMPLANRATIANMAPEYGATMGYFPVDEQTLKYMELTGRDTKLIETVKQYTQAQGLWHEPDADVVYSSQLELDLSTVVPAMAGPKRPQDRIVLSDMQSQWKHDMEASLSPDRAAGASVEVDCDGSQFELGDGDVVIAAHHQLHEHEQSGRDDGGRSPGQEGQGEGAQPKTVGQDVAGARLQGGDRVPWSGAVSSMISRRSASTSSATDARPASATPGRCRTRSMMRSTSTISWPRRSSVVTATSRDASAQTCVRTTWPHRHWSWPTPWLVPWT